MSTFEAKRISSFQSLPNCLLSFKKSVMFPLCVKFKNSSKLCFTPNYSSLKVNRLRVIFETKLVDLLQLGALRTITNSYYAQGPNLIVMRLVKSLEQGFSMNQDWLFISLFTIQSFVVDNLSLLSIRLNGRSLVLKSNLICFLQQLKLVVSMVSSTI